VCVCVCVCMCVCVYVCMCVCMYVMYVCRDMLYLIDKIEMKALCY